jgi:MoaA/NifB/PqqE/SkfB family radical SAM enzyme
MRGLINEGKRPGKFIRSGDKSYSHMYVPGFPSGASDRMYKFEMNRIFSEDDNNSLLRFVFLAITRKCPLKCEHCFEWENLNKKETFNYEQLENVVYKLKEAGVVQIFLSGGEPMIRVKEIEKLCKKFSRDIDFWVVTSGFNATFDNLKILKNAGVSGISVSIDHYEKSIHNSFRGSPKAFDDAIATVKNARLLDLPVTMSVCVLKSFANETDLMNYINFAKSLDASFVQFLEPKAVGNYASKDVLLNDSHKEIIRNVTLKINTQSEYFDYPIMMYHGYHHKQVGCFAAGNRSLYIDSSGDVLSCPFCHNKAGNILKDDFHTLVGTIKGIGCTDYKTAEI